MKANNKKKAKIRTEFVDFSGAASYNPVDSEDIRAEPELASERGDKSQAKKKANKTSSFVPGKIRLIKPDSQPERSLHKKSYTNIVYLILIVLWSVLIGIYLFDVGGSRDWIRNQIESVGVFDTEDAEVDQNSAPEAPQDNAETEESEVPDPDDYYDEKPLESVEEDPEDWPEDIDKTVPAFSGGILDKISIGVGIWTLDYVEVESDSEKAYLENLKSAGFTAEISQTSGRVKMISADHSEKKLHITANFDLNAKTMQLIVIDLDEVE
ncbi:hypothetical protein GF357_04440 [Candidatus Dojkabacteria bacterium]|nr:hypothetical protein [Candidatus Dojkabacteria bacterium]